MTRDSASPLGVLQRIRQPPAQPRPGERCELCAVDLPDEHGHVVDLDDHSLLCSCRPCALLFIDRGAAAGRFRAVPDRYVVLDPIELPPGLWDELAIPVSTAFFLRSSRTDEVACFYPSPAGATESLLPMETWKEIESSDPQLASVEPDVEAVLVRTSAGGRLDAYVVPVDVCYELVGAIRSLWRGFDGGRLVHERVDALFDRIERRAVRPRG